MCSKWRKPVPSSWSFTLRLQDFLVWSAVPNVRIHFLRPRNFEVCFDKISLLGTPSGKSRDDSEQNIKKAYLIVPYVGKTSITLQRRIYQEFVLSGVATVASYTTTKVESYFNLKPRTSKLFISDLVYKFTCSRDESTTYIGETNRQLCRRAADHTGKDNKICCIWSPSTLQGVPIHTQHRWFIRSCAEMRHI